MSKIVYYDKNIVVINKDYGVSTQPDNTVGEDALSIASQRLRDLGEEGTLFPIHRLDKVVGGLLVFARNKEVAKELSSSMCDGEFSKEYIAVTEGAPLGGKMTDYLVKNSALSTAVVCTKDKCGAKFAELDYDVIETVKAEKGDKTLVKISLKTGRFHQIRAQFSSRGYALVGDKKYGSKDRRAYHPTLFAYRLSFSLFGKDYTFTENPDFDSYPWNLFNKKIYNEALND